MPYFPYPDSRDSWECVICRERDPHLKGGTVAHGPYDLGDGRKHPIHRDCVVAFHKIDPLCPYCKVGTDVSRLLSVCEKWALSTQQFLNRSKKQLSHPINQIYGGVGLALLGKVFQKPPLTAVGMGLQAYVLHQTIRYGGGHVSTAYEIERLSGEILKDLRGQLRIGRKLDELKEIAAAYPRYYLHIAAWIHSQDMREVEEGVRSTREFSLQTIQKDRFLRFWAMSAALGALYFGRKSF